MKKVNIFYFPGKTQNLSAPTPSPKKLPTQAKYSKFPQCPPSSGKIHQTAGEFCCFRGFFPKHSPKTGDFSPSYEETRRLRPLHQTGHAPSREKGGSYWKKGTKKPNGKTPLGYFCIFLRKENIVKTSNQSVLAK